MTFALTAFQAYGIEAEEAVNKRYKQVAILTITAANTNFDLDLGDLAPGTFWDAVDGSEPGDTGLAAFKDINTRALSFIGVGGTGIAGYAKADASIPTISLLDSNASSGGNASETLTVSGLLTSDTIVSARVTTAGANNVAVRTFAKTCAVAGQYITVWTADPGANAVVTLGVQRATTTVQAGTYQLSMDSTYTQMPNLLFLTGDAPTAYTIQLEWVLKPGQSPVEVYASA